jgi:hypothetical protein
LVDGLLLEDDDEREGRMLSLLYGDEDADLEEEYDVDSVLDGGGGAELVLLYDEELAPDGVREAPVADLRALRRLLPRLPLPEDPNPSRFHESVSPPSVFVGEPYDDDGEVVVDDDSLPYEVDDGL